MNEDLRRVRDLSKKHNAKDKMNGSLIWSPTNFSKAVKDFDVENVRLTKDKLYDLGVLTSNLRK